jgi:ThiF family
MTTIDGASRYRDRIIGLSGMSELENKTVVLAGLGSVGSDLGAKLVRLGIRVVACDPDVLAVENLIRWGLPASIEDDVEKPKPHVWRDILRRAVPGARVEGHAIDIVRQAVTFERLVVSEKPDLLVAATDTRDSRSMVNAMAACHGIPALFVGLSDGASSVRIEVVESAQRGPCHLCAVFAEGGTTGDIDKRSRMPYGTDVDPNPRGVPALPVDIALGTAIATRIALLLLGGGDWRQYMKNGEQRGNVLFFSLRPDHWVFEGAYDRLVYQVQRFADCPGCGEREDVVDG